MTFTAAQLLRHPFLLIFYFALMFPFGRAVEMVSSLIEFGAGNRDTQLAVLPPARRLLMEVVSLPSA